MLRRVLLLVGCSALVAGSVFAAHHMAGEDQMAGMHQPAAEGAAVLEYITKTENYQEWPLWPGKGELYQGQHPHGAFLTTYVSPGALKAIDSKAGTIPAGEFVIKENYSPEKKLAAITVMYKKSGYDPAGGDWFWLKFKPDGTIEKEGKVGGCIGCHAAVKPNDWLFTGPVK
jgi:hypothetical protein